MYDQYLVATCSLGAGNWCTKQGMALIKLSWDGMERREKDREDKGEIYLLQGQDEGISDHLVYCEEIPYCKCLSPGVSSI